MAINFPDNPFIGDVYTFGSVSCKWDGVAWRRIPDPGAKGEKVRMVRMVLMV